MAERGHTGDTHKTAFKLPAGRDLLMLLLPIGGICIALGLDLGLDNANPASYSRYTFDYALAIALAVYIILAVIACFVPKLCRKLVHAAPWFFAIPLFFEALQICTLKTGLFKLPWAPSPAYVIESFDDRPDQLVGYFVETMTRLFIGIAIGGVTGFISGLLMGWSKVWNYWLAPLLKVIGPLPSAAWIPIAVTIMPTVKAAGLLLISIAMWFPMTLMLSSGIKATPKKQVERARVLGASEWYILFHVALPSATNTIFTGIFMGLSNSFSALLVAETLGVKAGLGWYISYATGWGDYATVYAIVGVFIVVFFLIMQLCFTVRDYVMKWQKGIVRW